MFNLDVDITVANQDSLQIVIRCRPWFQIQKLGYMIGHKSWVLLVMVSIGISHERGGAGEESMTLEA